MKSKSILLLLFLSAFCITTNAQINKRILPYYDTIANKYGYYDTLTNRIITPAYKYASFFIDNHAVVKGESQFISKIIDTLGNVILTSADWTCAIPRKGKLAVYRRDDKTLNYKWGLISLKGDTLLPFIYSEYLEDYDSDYFLFSRYESGKDKRGKFYQKTWYVKINANSLKEEKYEPVEEKSDTIYINDSIYYNNYEITIRSKKYDHSYFKRAIITKNKTLLFNEGFDRKYSILMLEKNSSRVLNDAKLLSYFGCNFLIERRVLPDSIIVKNDQYISQEEIRYYPKYYFSGFKNEVYDRSFNKIELDTTYKIISDASENWFLCLKDSSLYFMNCLSKKIVKVVALPKESLDDMSDLYSYALYARFIGGKTLFYESISKDEKKYFMLDTLGNKTYINAECFPAEYNLRQGDPDLYGSRYDPKQKHLKDIFNVEKDEIPRAEFYFQKSNSEYIISKRKLSGTVDTSYLYDVYDYEGNLQVKNVYTTYETLIYDYDTMGNGEEYYSPTIQLPYIRAQKNLIKILSGETKEKGIMPWPSTEYLLYPNGKLFFANSGYQISYSANDKLYVIFQASQSKYITLGYVSEQGRFYYPKLK